MSEIIKDTDDLTDEKLKAHNPRIMRTHQDAALGGSMDKWGDLGGITYSMQSSRYVTGHQRMRKLKEKYGGRVKIYIEQNFDNPDEFGTVGLGYVGVEGTNVRFAYREVSFDEANERAAGVAANNATGENDDQMLAQIDYELSQLDNGADLLALTGQTDKEIESLLRSVGVGDDPEPPADDQPDEAKNEKLSFALSPDQREVVELALAQAKSTNEIPHTNLDNINGTALYYICKDYAETHTSQNTQQASDTPDQAEPADTPSAPDLTSIPS